MELVSPDSIFLPQRGFVNGTPITKGVRCVVNNQSLLDTMHIILIIYLVIANTHLKSTPKKRSVVGLPGERNGKFKEKLFIYLALAKPALPGQFDLLVSSQSKANASKYFCLFQCAAQNKSRDF